MTIKDIEDWANKNKVPILFEEVPGMMEVDLAFFERDRKSVIDFMEKNRFAGLLVNYYSVPNQIENTHKRLIEFWEKEEI